MKFGKRLQTQLDESLPEWKDKYLSYKRLKRRLKLISAPEDDDGEGLAAPQPRRPESGGRSPGSPGDGADAFGEVFHGHGGGGDSQRKGSSASDAGTELRPRPWCEAAPVGSLTAEEADFLHLLQAELEKFNAFFVDKEEEYVIRLQALRERIEQLNEKAATESNLDEEMIKVQKDFVNFHGEMVLLENYSSLNYTGLVKILKKHDKRTGLLLRMSFIQNVLHQPFFTTELLSELVHECELSLQSLFPLVPGEDMSPTMPPPGSSVYGTGSGGNSMAQIDAVCSVQGAVPSDGSVSQSEGQEKLLLDGDEAEDVYKGTMAALKTMKELRKGSSTYNLFSLPPYEQRSSNDVSPAAEDISPSRLHGLIPPRLKD